MLDHYIHALANLRTDKSPSRWTTETRYRAPHKPFLLWAVIDLYAEGAIQSNFVELNSRLVDGFDQYWSMVIGSNHSGDPVLPFYHLESSGFWHLVPQPGKESTLPVVGQIRSRVRLRELVIGARLDDDLVTLLGFSEPRETLRRVLHETYFAPEVRPLLVEVGEVEAEAFRYRTELRQRTRQRFELREVLGKEYRLEARSTAFRRMVVEAYDHTCAMCGVRLVTPEGRTAVAAAHVVPWSESHNDDSRNGIALCGLHHWTFDQGLTGIALDHVITVSKIIPADQSTEPIMTLNGRTVRRPEDPLLWPAREALRWHRNHVFRP